MVIWKDPLFVNRNGSGKTDRRGKAFVTAQQTNSMTASGVVSILRKRYLSRLGVAHAGGCMAYIRRWADFYNDVRRESYLEEPSRQDGLWYQSVSVKCLGEEGQSSAARGDGAAPRGGRQTPSITVLGDHAITALAHKRKSFLMPCIFLTAS